MMLYWEEKERERGKEKEEEQEEEGGEDERKQERKKRRRGGCRSQFGKIDLRYSTLLNKQELSNQLLSRNGDKIIEHKIILIIFIELWAAKRNTQNSRIPPLTLPMFCLRPCRQVLKMLGCQFVLSREIGFGREKVCVSGHYNQCLRLAFARKPNFIYFPYTFNFIIVDLGDLLEK